MSVELLTKKLSNKDRSMLHLAMKMAETSECGQRHGAVIVRGGSVLSVGFNKWRNKPISGVSPLPKQELKTMTVHAEIDALSRVSDASGAIVYVARINKRGQACFSRPCDDCYAALKDAGVKRIVFTTNEF